MRKEPDKVKFIEIETYVHATENIDRVVEAIKNILLRGEKIPIILEVLWGTFGNRIIRVKVFIERGSEKILKNILCNLSNIDKLRETLENRVDSAGNLYLRLNKQELIKGNLVLEDESDDIVRVKARVSRKLLKESTNKLIEEICQE